LKFESCTVRDEVSWWYSFPTRHIFPHERFFDVLRFLTRLPHGLEDLNVSLLLIFDFQGPEGSDTDEARADASHRRGDSCNATLVGTEGGTERWAESTELDGRS